jgi:hypothetical protein
MIINVYCYSGKENWTRYDHKCVLVFRQSTHNFCQISMKLEIFRQIFKKYSNVNFHEIPFSGSRAVPCGRTA